ncbi:unnamed protein product [Rangifer tarandus platyrhynchus]|uniref:Uncharacterized protein n=1 Tax=Rangifer tarandus platyrhynchus TaxID=3082113 RepID=A0ABN8ZU27_RANTA|nr:unnamed protein product [Rangifer tarandus platyrhynchus]
MSMKRAWGPRTRPWSRRLPSRHSPEHLHTGRTLTHSVQRREPIRYFSECLLNTYSMPDTWEGKMKEPGNVPVVKKQTVNKPTPGRTLQAVMRTLDNQVL